MMPVDWEKFDSPEEIKRALEWLEGVEKRLAKLEKKERERKAVSSTLRAALKRLDSLMDVWESKSGNRVQ